MNLKGWSPWLSDPFKTGSQGSVYTEHQHQCHTALIELLSFLNKPNESLPKRLATPTYPHSLSITFLDPPLDSMLQSFPDNQHAEELIAMKRTARAPKSPSNVSPDDRRQSSSSSSEVNSVSSLHYVQWNFCSAHELEHGKM